MSGGGVVNIGSLAAEIELVEMGLTSSIQSHFVIQFFQK